MAPSTGGEKYPAFKAVFDFQKGEAQKDFDAAQSIASNEEKARRLETANGKLRELIDPIQSYESDRSALERLTRDRDLLARPATQVNPAIALAQLGIVRGDEILAGATPPGVSDARDTIAAARKAIADGGATLKSLKRAIDDEQRRERDAKKALAKAGKK